MGAIRGPWARRVLGACCAASLTAGLALVLVDRLWPPDLSRYEDRSSLVVARDGRLLRAFLSDDGKWRLETRVGDVQPGYLRMLVAFEDKRFYRHRGVDPLALARAIRQALRNGRVVSGASTLTMQTVRLLEPRPRTVWSKAVEMFRASQLEARLSKEQILDIYLTLAPFGGNVEGVRAASLIYFGKDPKDLTPSEAALLVALPQAPNRLRPDRHPERAREARNKVLARALGKGVISPEAAARAQAAPLEVRLHPMPFLAPHLAERLTRERRDRDVVRTTIDLEVQAQAERLARQAVHRIDPHANAAVLVADLESREIRAYVGSADYAAVQRAGMIDLTRAVRSPGSALKPLIYALAFDRRVAHPDTLVADRRRRYADYAPRNFSRGFSGDVTLREALQRSLNQPAVAVLERLGPLVFEHALLDAGVELRYRREAGAANLSIALGGVGVTLGDLVTLYGGLADGGTVRPLRLEPDAERSQELRFAGRLGAWYVSRILEAAPRSFTARAASDIAPIAFKTGTSFGSRDAWAVGFGKGHVVGVWIGRPDGRPCPGCTGIATAAPLLFKIFAVLPDRFHGEAPAPDGFLPGPTDALPRGLQRLDGTKLAHAGARGQPPTIWFPVDGAEIVVPEGAAISFKVDGGRRPFLWLVDGSPVGPPSWRKTASWTPGEAGFSTVSVVDARGRSARVHYRVRR